MFGVDLTTRVKAEDSAIPTLLQSCIEHIESTGTKRETASGSVGCVYVHMIYTCTWKNDFWASCVVLLCLL